MAKYDICYSETYSEVYTVEADSYEDAVKKLDSDIREGRRNGPELCDTSSYEDVTKKTSKGLKIGRVVYIRHKEFGEDTKYVIRESDEYKGYKIYQEKCPSGYFMSQSWLIVKEGSDPLLFMAESYNNLSLEEIYDAIDEREESGEFGYSAFKKNYLVNKDTMSDVYVIHSGGNVRI